MSMHIFMCSLHIFTDNRKLPEMFFVSLRGKKKNTGMYCYGTSKLTVNQLVPFPIIPFFFFCIIPLTKARTSMGLLAIAVQSIVLQHS